MNAYLEIKQDRRRRMADTLYRRMVAAGMDQTRLAKVSGVAREYICRYLTAESEPRPDNLKKLAKGLGCTVAEIIYEAEGVVPITDGLLLSASEIHRLTGKSRRGSQMEVLDAMGINYKENGIGELAVSRKHVESVLSGGHHQKSSAAAHNFAALGG